MNETSLDVAWERTLRLPFVTYFLCALCFTVFYLQVSAKTDGTLGYPFYADGLRIWNWEYWGLWTSFFLHTGVAHVAFNVYWLFRFGSVVESFIGWRRYLLFWVAGTAFSSLMQLFFSGQVGVGASGFVYALFGLIWFGGKSQPYLARTLDANTVALFLLWMIGCIILTWMGTFLVGNAAHVGGFLFGGLCAYAFWIRDSLFWKRAVVAITVVSFLPLFYAPWLSTWNLCQAANAYARARYEPALAYLERVNMPEYREYIFSLRMNSLQQLGRSAEIADAYKNLFAQPPAGGLTDPAFLYNAYAWILATSPDEKIRDPAQAIHYAQLACGQDDNAPGDYLDTLAAAYASANQFDQAVKWQQKAIDGNPGAQDIDELKAHLKLFQAGKPLRDGANPP